MMVKYVLWEDGTADCKGWLIPQESIFPGIVVGDGETVYALPKGSTIEGDEGDITADMLADGEIPADKTWTYGDVITEDDFDEYALIWSDGRDVVALDWAQCETTDCYGYFKNTNWTIIIKGDEVEGYDVRVVDTYDLDTDEKGDGNLTTGGLGHHADLMMLDECDFPFAIRYWSQHSGEELDKCELLSADEVADRFESREDWPEIAEWAGIDYSQEN